MLSAMLRAGTVVLTVFCCTSLAFAGGNTGTRARLSELDAEAFERAMSLYQAADRTNERQPWTVAQYDQIMESVGIYTREGQFAALGAVVIALRDRKIDEASRRLDALQNTDGFILEADLAHQVDALAAIVEHLTTPDDGGAMSAPAAGALRSNVTNTSATYDDSDRNTTDYSDNLSLSTNEDAIQTGAMSSSTSSMPSASGNGITSNLFDDDYNTTRVCFTIEVERHSSRELAEQRVELLRRTYSRARLAIDHTTEESFVVVVGYYPTTDEASKDLRSVGRTTGKLCRVAETTIAERL